MAAEIIRFADFELDRGAYQLRCQGRVIPIERKPFDLLFLLAERPGQLVSRDEIHQRIWGKSVFVDSEAAINTAIRKIRRALDDQARKPHFVVRVPGKGYRFDGSVEGVNLERTATISSTTFVGRKSEMAALCAAIDAALGGQPSLVMVAGEPGIGKTRLAEEGGAYARAHGFQVLVGRCYEGDTVSPYSAFVEVIRDYLSTLSDDALRAALVDGASDLAKLLPEICKRIPELPTSLAADPNGERMRLFDSVAALLVNASKANPIMLRLEDLHWVDKASLPLLQHLAHRFKGSRLIVVGTYRDVELEPSNPLSAVLAELKHERLSQRLSLRGLSESEVKELIEAISQQQVADGRDKDFVRAVLSQTEGNPFFIEEVLRHLVESGAWYRRDGRWVTDAKSIAEMGIPEGVHDVIGRRLSRLSKTTNRMLAAAAVLGREFEFEVLTPMTGLSEDEMIQAVEEALASRLVVETRGRMGPCYTFIHALVRQKLDEELSLPRKQRLHLKAAQTIEAVHERNLEPHVAALANHYRMAGAAADAEKAIDYSIRAGRAAYALFAYEEAGAHWRAALELMDEQGGGDRKRRSALLLLLGDQLISSGTKAIEYLEAAAPLFEELGDKEAACDVYLLLASFLSSNNVGAMDVPRAMPYFKKAEALLAQQPESYRHAMFYVFMAGTYGWAVRIADGLAAAKRAIEISERLHLDGFWSIAAMQYSSALVLSGSVTEGLRLADQARRRADPINDTLLGSVVAWIGGGCYQALRNPREAQDWYASELAKPRTANALRRAAPYARGREWNMLSLLQSALVGIYLEAGRLAEARAYVAEYEFPSKPPLLLFFEGQWESASKQLTADYASSHTTGALLGESVQTLDLARLHRFTGEGAQAMQFLQRALEISVDGGDICSELITRSALATMTADAGHAAEAVSHLQRCRQIVGAGENWFGVAGLVERAEAVVAAAQGKYSSAETRFKKAIATFQHYCLPWEEADTLQYWGRALLAAGERARAIEKFDDAIEIYRSHGAGTRFVEYVMADRKRAQVSRIGPSRGISRTAR